MTTGESPEQISPTDQPVTLERVRLLRSISTELRTARERAGLSVAELHRRTGISRTVLQGYETGKFAPGSLELRKVCEALGVTPNRIIFGEDKIPERSPSSVESLLGDMTKAQQVSQLGAMFSMLTFEEQNALITLVESILAPRAGGIEKLRLGYKALHTISANEALGPVIEEFSKKMMDSLPPELLKKLEEIGQEAKNLDQDPSETT